MHVDYTVVKKEVFDVAGFLYLLKTHQPEMIKVNVYKQVTIWKDGICVLLG